MAGTGRVPSKLKDTPADRLERLKAKAEAIKKQLAEQKKASESGGSVVGMPAGDAELRIKALSRATDLIDAGITDFKDVARTMYEGIGEDAIPFIKIAYFGAYASASDEVQDTLTPLDQIRKLSHEDLLRIVTEKRSKGNTPMEDSNLGQTQALESCVDRKHSWPLLGSKKLAWAPDDPYLLDLSIPLASPGERLTQVGYEGRLADRVAWMAVKEGFSPMGMAKAAARELQVPVDDLLPVHLEWEKTPSKPTHWSVAAKIVGTEVFRGTLQGIDLPKGPLSPDPAAVEIIQEATLQTWLARVAFPAN
ncbi:MAG: hypothetical protein NTW19_01520 [Planctomycetota bacterium]|nr:hypothetical protein [Planctomycetota bacterium]